MHSLYHSIILYLYSFLQSITNLSRKLVEFQHYFLSNPHCLHPVVVVVHGQPSNLRRIGNQLFSGGVDAGQQFINLGESNKLLQGNWDLNVKLQDSGSHVPDQNGGFVVLDDSPEAVLLHGDLLNQSGDFPLKVQVLPGPDELLSENVDALLKLNDLVETSCFFHKFTYPFFLRTFFYYEILRIES